MPKEQVQIIHTSTSPLTLLLVAIAGGIIAVSFQPLIVLLYSHLGISTVPISYQPIASKEIVEQTLTTTMTTKTTTSTTIITTTTTETTKTTTATTVRNDPTVDEEPVLLKNEPIKIDIPVSTTPKPKAKKIEPVKTKKTVEQPEIIDVTGRNKEIPDEVKNFKPTQISTLFFSSLPNIRIATLDSVSFLFHLFFLKTR